jgi:G3E family GTPase
MSRTKVDIISGFLGAGKTTFIRRLLDGAVAREKVVLIENEFGEVGIDGGFLKDSGIQIKEMNSGCICCSLVGDFSSSLKEILTKFAPDRIIIEPSGVGKLSDIMKAVSNVETDLPVEQNSAVTLVDVKKCKMYMKNFGEFFNNQIQFATTVVLSRTDVADSAAVEQAVQMIRTVNPTATIITTPIAQLSGEKLLEILEKPVDLKTELLKQVRDEDEDDDECECGHHHHHHHDHEDHDHEDHDHEDHDHEDHDHEDHDHDDHDHEDHEDHDHEHEHHHHHHHHDADEVFTSWGLENVPAMTEDKLKGILEKLSETTDFGTVIRSKGMVPSDKSGEWLYFDLVPGEVEIRRESPDYTGKVCVIGSDLKEDALEKEFKG